jgi:CHAD domain-containing protein
MPQRHPHRSEPGRILPANTPVPPRQALLHQMQTSLTDTVRLLITWSSAPKPETLHQARVAWRRLKCLSRFYRPLLTQPVARYQRVLRDLWQRTGLLRNLDVALDSTLPAWHLMHPDAARQEWPSLIRHLQRERRSARRGLQNALAQAEAQAGFLAIQEGLERGTARHQPRHDRDWKRWTRHRLRDLQQKIKKWRATTHPHKQHARRILIKQVRYVLEGLETTKAGRQMRHQRKRAQKMQKTWGQNQDLRATLALIEQSGMFALTARAWRSSHKGEG